MRNCNNFSANIVVESINTVGVNKTVSNPQTSLDAFINLSKHVESVLYTIFCNSVLVVSSSNNHFAVVLEDKVALLGGDAAQLSILGPVDCFGLDFNPTYKVLQCTNKLKTLLKVQLYRFYMEIFLIFLIF